MAIYLNVVRCLSLAFLFHIHFSLLLTDQIIDISPHSYLIPIFKQIDIFAVPFVRFEMAHRFASGEMKRIIIKEKKQTVND